MSRESRTFFKFHLLLTLIRLFLSSTIVPSVSPGPSVVSPLVTLYSVTVSSLWLCRTTLSNKASLLDLVRLRAGRSLSVWADSVSRSGTSFDSLLWLLSPMKLVTFSFTFSSVSSLWYASFTISVMGYVTYLSTSSSSDISTSTSVSGTPSLLFGGGRTRSTVQNVKPLIWKWHQYCQKM